MMDIVVGKKGTQVHQWLCTSDRREKGTTDYLCEGREDYELLIRIASQISHNDSESKA